MTHGPGSGAAGAPPVPKIFSLPTDLAYRLRMCAARRRLPRTEIVRQALAEHLAYDPERRSREAVFLPPELLERLTEAAARRGIRPERLVTDLLAEGLGAPPPAAAKGSSTDPNG